MTTTTAHAQPTDIEKQSLAVPVGIEPISAKPLDVQGVMNEANSLRSEASKDWQQFYVAGREATKKTMQKVYGLYYVVMHNDEGSKVVARMKEKVPEKKVRVNTREAAIFIRYVFEDFDDKQVHVYSVTLEHAFSKRIEPAGFVAWVNGYRDCFEGIRREVANSKGSEEGLKLWQCGMDWAKGANVIKTIEADDWDEDEPCRVLIALPNGDGTASVKDTELPLEQVKQVLGIYSRAVVERNKPKGKKRRTLSAQEKLAKRQLKADLSYQEQLVDEYRFNLSQATERDHKVDMETARSNLCLAQSRIVGLEAAIKAFGTSGSAE